MKTKTTRITSLFLALVMMLSTFAGFSTTVQAKTKQWKKSDVLLGEVQGQLVSHMNGDSFDINIGTFDCIEMVATSDIPMDIMIESDSDSDPKNILESFSDVTKHNHRFLNCRGKFTVTISRGADGLGRIGNYSVKLYNRIPKPSIKKLTAKKNTITVKWNKKPGVTGYQIQYSSNEDFKNAKKIKIKGAKNTVATIKKLKKNRRYYVRVRTYYKAGQRKFCSEWSGVKKVKTKK